MIKTKQEEERVKLEREEKRDIDSEIGQFEIKDN